MPNFHHPIRNLRPRPVKSRWWRVHPRANGSASVPTPAPGPARCLLPCALLVAWQLVAANAIAAAPASIDLRMTPAAIQQLEANKHSNETVDANLTTDGVTNVPVKVRYRGRWSRSWDKSPLKVFVPTNAIDGRSSLNLNSTYRDPSWIRERLAYHVHEAAGVPASKTRFVEVRFNSKFHGAYVDVEQVDSHFLKARGLKGGEAYKAVGAGAAADERRLSPEIRYQREYEKQTKGKTNYQSLVAFCEALDKTTDVDRFFQEHVDLDRYINYLAANILIQNWDGLNKNHVLVREPGPSGKWFVVPWDVDRTFGDWPASTSGGAFNMYKLPIELGIQSSPGVTGWNRLQNRFWQSKALRNRLATRLEQLLATEFTAARLDPVIDAWAAEIRTRADVDRLAWGTGSQMGLAGGIREIKDFIAHRRTFVEAALPALRRD